MDISPKDVVFSPPFEEVNHTTIKLTNTTNHPLIYKVKTTSPTVYCVRPNASTVEAGKSKEIQITRQSKPVTQGEQSKDKFMILSAAVDSQRFGHIESISEIWSVLEKDHGSHEIDAQKLRVSYSGQQKSTQGLSGAGSQNGGDYSGSGHNGAAAAGAAGVAGVGAAGYGSPHGSSKAPDYSNQSFQNSQNPSARGTDYSNQIFASPQSGSHVDAHGYQSQAGAYTPESKAGGTYSGSAGAGVGGQTRSQSATPSRGDFDSQNFSPSRTAERYDSSNADDYDLSRKDNSVKNSFDNHAGSQSSSKDYSSNSQSGNDFTTAKGPLGKDTQSFDGKSLKHGDGGSSLRKQTSASGQSTSAISTGSGPDGLVTVDDIQGTPGVPRKSKLIDEGNALQGPKLANSNLPDGPKPEHGTEHHAADHSEKEAGEKDSGLKSTSGQGQTSREYSSTTNKDSRSQSSSSYNTSSSQGYLASAQETAGQYASSAADAAGTAAGVAAGAAGVAASQVSNWFSSSPSGANQGRGQSTQGASAANSRSVNSDTTSQSSKLQGSYAGGFESIVNGGGFEAAPASKSAERSVAGGPKVDQYSSSPLASGSKGGANHFFSNSDAANYGSQTGSSFDNDSNKDSTVGADKISGTGAGSVAGAGVASQGESYNSGNKQKYPGDIADKKNDVTDQFKGNYEHTSKQASSDLKGSANKSNIGSGSTGSQTSGPQGYDAHSAYSGQSGSNYSSGYGNSQYSDQSRGSDALAGAAVGSASRDGLGGKQPDLKSASKDIKDSDYKGASHELDSAVHNRSYSSENKHDSKAINSSNNDSYSSPSRGYSSSHSSGQNQGSSPKSTYGTRDASVAGNSGFDATVNSTAASVSGAYSERDPTSTTLQRDSHASAAPNVAKQSEVPLNVTVLLVALAFLVGWKFF